MNRKYAEYLLNKTKEDYNLIADEFSRTRERPWEEIEFLFKDYLSPEDKILDLGCGNGRYLEFFKGKNVDYSGVDNSEKLIELARNKYPGVDFKVGNALGLSFPDNFFDKVYSIAVLHQVPSEYLRIKFLKEVKRILKPRGFLVITVWKFHEPKELYLFFKYTILKLIRKTELDWKDIFEPWGKKTERYYHCFSKKELINLVKKGGFKIKESGVVKNKRGNRQNIYLIAEK
jgi:alkylated DNA repair protein alkB family protein 8